MIESVPLHGGQLRQIAERFNVPLSRLIDFSANINPDGPPPGVLSTLRAKLENLATLTEYPDLEEAELKRAIAAYAGVAPGNLIVANGFVTLLEAALRALSIQRCLLPVPAFVEYRRSLTRVGVEIDTHVLSADRDFRYELDAMLHGSHDAILLANPQNPSGVLMARDTLLELVGACAQRNITVLLDEAFIDYASSQSLTRDVHQFSNLIAFRSVTKFHGIPGLRVAYAAANDSTAHTIEKQLPPWPITTLASCAVISALEDQAYMERTGRQNQRSRDPLRARLEALGIHTYPAAANFLLMRLPQGIATERFWERMIVDHHHVLRLCSNYEGLPPGHLRAAVRTDAENDGLVEAITRTFKSWNLSS